MSLSDAALVGGCSAVLTAALVGALIPALRRRGVVDVPAGRNLHVVPTPRGGGLAIILSLVICSLAACAVLLIPDSSMRYTGTAGALPAMLVALTPIVFMAGLGFFDDWWSLTALQRLAFQLATGLAWGITLRTVLWPSLPTWLVASAGVLFLTADVNLTNFMDGSNGLVALHGLVTSTWFVVVASVVDEPMLGIIAAALAGAALGFLPFNLPRARVFLGDVGSYTFGASWAVLGLMLLRVDAPLEVVGAPLVPLLADSVATLVRRMYHGDRVFEPHRLHVYQRLIAAGWSHTRMALVFAGFTVTCCLVGSVSLSSGQWLVRLAVIVVLCVIAVLYLNLPRLISPAARWHVFRESMTS